MHYKQPQQTATKQVIQTNKTTHKTINQTQQNQNQTAALNKQ